MAIELGGTLTYDEILEMQKYSGVPGVNVKWKGATGDGTTDDTAAIQAAVDWQEVQLTVTATTSVSGTTLTFAGSSVPARIAGSIQCHVRNITNEDSIPFDTMVESHDGTTVTMTKAAAEQVDIGDVIGFRFVNPGVIYFPQGTYKITAPIEFNHPGELTIVFEGCGAGSHITGNFAGSLLERSMTSITGGIKVIRNLKLTNSNAAGTGIELRGCVGSTSVENCYIDAWRGIVCNSGNSWLIQNCKLIWHNNTAGSIGIFASNGVAVINCDIQSYEHGIRHGDTGAVGLQVIGGRYEVNTVGILLGQDEDGVSSQSSAFLLTGLSMEANDTHINLYNAAAGMIAGVSMGTGVEIDYGLRIQGASNVGVHNLSVGGNYAVAAVDATNSNGGVDFCGLIINNTGSGDDFIYPDAIYNVTFNGAMTPMVFAELPSAGTAGRRGFVTNCSTTTFHANADGAGANTVPVFDNGSAWKVG